MVLCPGYLFPTVQRRLSHTTALGQFCSGMGSVLLLSLRGDVGKGVGVQPHTLAGAGGAHICAASCSPWDLLSAEAD